MCVWGSFSGLLAVCISNHAPAAPIPRKLLARKASTASQRSLRIYSKMFMLSWSGTTRALFIAFYSKVRLFLHYGQAGVVLEFGPGTPEPPPKKKLHWQRAWRLTWTA